MKNSLLLLLLVYASVAFGQNKSFDYAYSNSDGRGIFVYSIADKKEVPIVKTGSDPSISPNGKKLAYTAYRKDGSRFIQVIDLNSKKKIALKTKSTNCYGPVWSPNGKMILYNCFNDENGNWMIGVIDSGNKVNKVFGSALYNYFSPNWLGNNKIVIQNMEDILVLDLEGSIIENYHMKMLAGGLKELTDGVGDASDSMFRIINDNKKIIFSSEDDDPGIKNNDNGTPSAIFIYDIETKITARLSPMGYATGAPVIDGNNILFIGSKGNLPITDVYSIDMDGKNFKILFHNCVEISAKN
jgi:TolB protein